MNKKIRTTLLTSIFFFGLLTGLQAQDKYEYAVIQLYFGVKIDLTVSINGEKYEEKLGIDRTTLGSKYFGYDLSPALKKVNEMQNTGWELYDQGTMAYTSGEYKNDYIFYMRKKKN